MDVVMLLPYVFKLDWWRGDKAARVNKETFVANSRVGIWDFEPPIVVYMITARFWLLGG